MKKITKEEWAFIVILFLCVYIADNHIPKQVAFVSQVLTHVIFRLILALLFIFIIFPIKTNQLVSVIDIPKHFDCIIIAN